MNSSTFTRVTRSTPCPICEAKGWCGIAEDQTAAICMRIADGAVKETRNGGYLHILQEREFKPQRTRPVSSKLISTLAHIERRHAVYEEWLGSLSLSRTHANDLERRGLSDEAIARNLYATIPQSLSAIIRNCAALVAQCGPLNGVPGFYPDYEKEWRIPPYSPGIFIPSRDVQGRIQACQVRFDGDRRATRYIWFSSNPEKCAGGTSAPAAIHFARPWRVVSTSEAIITEGPLKADIISERLDACVIALPGVSSFQSDLGVRLKALLPSLQSVAIAFDADWHTKHEVEGAMLRLARVLDDAGLDWDVWDWANAKGLDDFLTQEGGVYAR